MNDPAPELTFRETMSGPLTLGETDPQVGADKGGATPFTFHATIGVDDMEAFIRDPEHAARLVATLSYPPFGQDIPVRRGSFNLFKPGDAPRTRLMTYGLSFEHEGRSYHLAGTKTIRDDPGPDLWSDTTRLFCRLHEGTDAHGPVVGAGILTLGLEDLLHLVASMHSSSTGLQGAQTVLRFGRFFLGTLWDLYGPGAHEPRAAQREDDPPARGGLS